MDNGQLQTSRQRFNAIVETTRDGILILDLRGKVLYCNPSAGELFNRPVPEVLGAELGVPILEEGLVTEIQIVRSTGGPGHAQVRVQKTRWNRQDAYLVVLTDVSERVLAEARLQLAASVFTHAREGIVITDARGTIVEINDAFVRLSGYSREEALGQNPRIFRAGSHPAEFYRAMWDELKTLGYWSGEIWNRHKDGEEYAVSLTISAVRDTDLKTQNYVGLSTNITLLKAHEHQVEQLERAAHYDALTKLPNRVLLTDRIQQAIVQSLRRNRLLALIFVDLDGFKAVNDVHGHEVGDQLLVAVSQRLKGVVREGDTLARIGGDEFVAVLIDLEHCEECESVLARMLRVVADPILIADAVLSVSASIGATLYPGDPANADTLLRHADQAMYQAKRDGKNCYRLFDVMSEEKEVV